MSEPILSDNQHDLLRETANIAMGLAGADLAQALDVFVELHIPEIIIVSSSEVYEYVKPPDVGFRETISIVRMGFQGLLSGEGLVVFGEESLDTVSGMLGGGGKVDSIRQRELLLDVANILTSACLGGLSTHLGGDLSVSRPTLFCHKLPPADVYKTLFNEERIKWDHTLIIKITFRLEHKNFGCDLLLFLSEPSIETLVSVLSRRLEDMEGTEK